MLPPGHIAAGYLVARLAVALTAPDLTASQMENLAMAGAFFGFAPDLDMFYAFWKERGLKHTGLNFTHRDFITHTPMAWLAIAFLVAIFGRTEFWYFFACIVLLGAGSHLFLDSTIMGVRWLYPFKNKFYALKDPGVERQNLAAGFFGHWSNLLRMYYKNARITVLAEIAIVIVALALYAFQQV